MINHATMILNQILTTFFFGYAFHNEMERDASSTLRGCLYQLLYSRSKFIL